MAGFIDSTFAAASRAAKALRIPQDKANNNLYFYSGGSWRDAGP